MARYRIVCSIVLTKLRIVVTVIVHYVFEQDHNLTSFDQIRAKNWTMLMDMSLMPM